MKNFFSRVEKPKPYCQLKMPIPCNQFTVRMTVYITKFITNSEKAQMVTNVCGNYTMPKGPGYSEN